MVYSVVVLLFLLIQKEILKGIPPSHKLVALNVPLSISPFRYCLPKILSFVVSGGGENVILAEDAVRLYFLLLGLGLLSKILPSKL